MNEPEHGAENAKRRRVAGRGFEDVCRRLGVLTAGVAFNFENLTRNFRVRAIDGQRESNFQEGIDRPIDLGLERDQAFASGHL